MSRGSVQGGFVEVGMAKVTGPALSLDAKGRIGHWVIYYGKGNARGWATQVDPQTAPQLQSRAIVRGVMQMVKKADAVDRGMLRGLLGSQWHTRLTAWLTRAQLSNAIALYAAWGGLTNEERQTWESVVPE